MKNKKIKVKVNGKEYDTIIDKEGVQRFVKNDVIDYLFNSGKIDVNKLSIDFYNKKFDKRSFAEFNMMLGYSICGFRDLSFFQDWKIENPLWNKTRSK
jgi:hypothetical protein